MKQYVLSHFLERLKVKHTKSFANKHFNEHPHKYSLYGLSKMLSDYGIDNAATRIEDKENDLFLLEPPFIAHTGSDFAVVYKVGTENVSYLWKDKDLTVSVPQFLQSWSGVALLAETSTESIEPNYIENKKKERFSMLQKGTLAFVAALMMVLAYIGNALFLNLEAV